MKGHCLFYYFYCPESTILFLNAFVKESLLISLSPTIYNNYWCKLIEPNSPIHFCSWVHHKVLSRRSWKAIERSFQHTSLSVFNSIEEYRSWKLLAQEIYSIATPFHQCKTLYHPVAAHYQPIPLYLSLTHRKHVIRECQAWETCG